MNQTLLYNIFRFAYYGIFVGLHLALMLGLFLEWLREKRTLKNTEDAELPAVSIVIPVHNESRRIGGLLQSLEAQDYPGTEYIFIDDRSEDESARLLAAFIERKKHAVSLPAKIITLTENPGPNHKQYALTKGIEAASGEFLLFTDADCILPPRWIRGMVQRMKDKTVGAAIGPVLKDPAAAKRPAAQENPAPLEDSSAREKPRGKSFFRLYECYDHAVRYVYLAGAVGLGAAGGGFGNNLILRRSCLDAVGGYEMVPASPTEDAALVSRIRSCSDYKIRAALGADVHVITQGEAGWRELISQTLRWNNGGLFSPDIATRLNYNFLMITISMGVLAFPFLPFFPSVWPLPAGPVTVMIFNTIAGLGLFGVSLPKRGVSYALALLFTPVYFTLMTILGFLGIKPKWKGKKI